VEIEGGTKVKNLLMAASGNAVDLMKGLSTMVDAFEMVGYDM
jgi:hypothetical protein